MEFIVCKVVLTRKRKKKKNRVTLAVNGERNLRIEEKWRKRTKKQEERSRCHKGLGAKWEEGVQHDQRREQAPRVGIYQKSDRKGEWAKLALEITPGEK